MNSSVRKLAFYLIAIFIPFILLGLVELTLRLSGFGAIPNLYKSVDAFDGFYEPNPKLIERYFVSPELAPNVSPDSYLFELPKPKGKLRLVTLGGSTMAGFPYGRFGSPAGLLEQRINASHPELDVEVISFAMSSVNSYTVYDILDEVIETEPDAVLIYMGHNEYLGVLGTSSNFSALSGHSAKHWFLKLKDWRLYQLVQRITYAISSISKPTIDKHGTEANKNTQDLPSDARTLMAKVAEGQQIPFDGERYHAGIQQFKDNLTRILSRLNSASIPAFVSTLAANEKDQRPFASKSEPTLDRLTSTLTQRPTRAKFLLNKEAEAINEKTHHANFSYAMASGLYLDTQYVDAQRYYTMASDFDTLRFRAPSEFNNVIKATAQHLQATLVDSQGLIKTQIHSKEGHGIIGANMMLEHLHPNTDGYFWIAEAFYQSLQQQQILPAPELIIAPNIALKASPVSIAEQQNANYKVQQLTSDYPFVEERIEVSLPTATTPIERIAIDFIKGQAWIKTQQQLAKQYQQEQKWREAAQSFANLYKALPQQPQFARTASLLFLRSQTLPLARHYAFQALQHEPQNTNFRLTYAETLYRTGNTEAAIKELKHVLDLDPNNQTATTILQQITP